ncbi:hypothetical protein FHX72_000386 [Pseudoclavibacter helvolus]|uniref:Uncharacterized protein n=1 Tax=Pseudoclavibacter helvolus TaxID=255205 RepID=A0A7W4UKR5_9MICO|nr:hypothetical protein [Pseudoclavibacter helvolus]
MKGAAQLLGIHEGPRSAAKSMFATKTAELLAEEPSWLVAPSLWICTVGSVRSVGALMTRLVSALALA